jgi:conjugative relaxase-like TrwC/TraI family protein
VCTRREAIGRVGIEIVLSIAKLRVGAEAYQLTGVAQSLTDYYSGAGEAAGMWAGRGAEALGLEGEVAGDDLRAVLAGIEPGTGGLSPNSETIRPYARRVPGFDLTFKAPKSVSVLYGISDDPRVQGALIEAGEAALQETLAWVEREVMAVRRGSGDQRYLANLAARNPEEAAAKRPRVEQGADLIAAVFRHRTSRAGDPLLHWHVLIPNMVRGADGRWSAFVHPDLYRMQKAAGEVFQATLRDEVTRRLGLRWRPGRHVAEVEGIPQRVLDAFSKRSAEIGAWLDASGRGRDPASRQEAVLATRRGKAELEDERLDTAWKVEGTQLGFGPEHADELLSGLAPEVPAVEVWKLPEVSYGPDGTPYTQDRTVTPDQWIADLLSRDLITRDATFTQADLYLAVAHRLGQGATVATIDRIAARVLASDLVLPIAPATDRDGMSRWTSTTMAGAERRLLDAFDQRDTRHSASNELVADALAAMPSLGGDQVDAVATICGGTDPVSVLIGPAGTGKTHTLAVIHQVLRAAGHELVGSAPSARAAVELEAGASMPSHTLHALTRHWAQPDNGPTHRTVLVVDEAAMASTVDLEPLVTRTVAAGGRVVLVGDHHQLPEVGPGGALAAAVEHVRSVAELSVNRRQVEPWEQEALAQLRAGSVPDAVATYRDHGRVVVTDDHDTMVTTAVDRYFEALAKGHRPVLMAGTNDTVTRLNNAVRERLALVGALDLDALVGSSGGRQIVAGDRVVLRRNAWMAQIDGPDIRVRNSDVATVVGSTPGGEMVVRRDGDQAVLTIDADYLRGGWVDHGYAVTAHRAQGGTWDQAIAVGLDGLYREAAYVQLSRGRRANTLVIPRPQMDQIDAELARHNTGIPLPGEQPAEAIEELIDRIEASRAKLLALSRDPHADRIAELARDWSYPELQARAGRASEVERAATARVGIDPALLTAAVERAHHTAHHVALGQQVKAFDRQNIGIVTAIDDTTGTLGVRFTAHDGRTATRTIPWTEASIVERQVPPPRILPPTAQRHLDVLSEACAQTLQAWHQHLADHGVTPGDGHRLARAADLLVTREAHRLAALQPDWLTTQLGHRPSSARGARLWDHAVDAIAQYRLRHEIPAHLDGLSVLPAADSSRYRDWIATARLLDQTRTELATVDSVEPRTTFRTTEDLAIRRVELEAILASAPPDVRPLMETLRSSDQQSLLDTQAELRQALERHGHRAAWILEHWPHVVEYAQVASAMERVAPATVGVLDRSAQVEAVELGF